jgi:hypothetical protein
MTVRDPKRWRDVTDGPEAPAGEVVRKMGDSDLPDDVTLARVRTRVMRTLARPRVRTPRVGLVASLMLGLGVAFAAVSFRGERERPVMPTEGSAPVAKPVRRALTPPALPAPPQSAPPIMERTELELLRRAPPALLERLHETVNSEGFAARNHRGFLGAGNQRFAADAIAIGAVLSRRDLIDEGWRAVEVAFQFQHKDGHFLDDALSVAYFLDHLSHALLLLGESDIGRDYRHRTDNLLPGLERAAIWLSAPPQLRALAQANRRAPARMFSCANAFGLTGLLLGNQRLIELGREFAEQGLAEQLPDGAFQMPGRLTYVYQGAVLWKLAWYALRFRGPRLDQALQKGAAWQLARTSPDGVVRMADAAPGMQLRRLRQDTWNVLEVTWALLYYGVRFDPAVIERAVAVRERATAIGIRQ